MNNNLVISNSVSIDMNEIPLLGVDEFRHNVIKMVRDGWRIVVMLTSPSLIEDKTRLYVVLSYEMNGQLVVFSSDVGKEYDSITPECAQAYVFERYIAEECGITIKGHPKLNPVTHQINPENFLKSLSSKTHEVAVGPVHAGIIEPGHFRFQCYGEEILNLEISLGYQHRGIERALVGGPDKRTIHYIQTLAGDTTIGHTTAYSQLVEGLADLEASIKAQVLRAVVLELERLANHTGDLGALSSDVGYLPTASYCGRLRGDFLNITADICGNRFGRGLVCPGGVNFDIGENIVSELLEKVNRAYKDVSGAVNLLWNTNSVVERFEGVGCLSPEISNQLGLSGPVARACGINRDVRFDFPYGIYRIHQIPVSIHSTSDVFARAYVRWLEIQRSVEFIKEQFSKISSGEFMSKFSGLSANKFIVSLVEGWRGEICHAAITDNNGKFSSYRIIDPSFRNWVGLEMAVRGGQISDFPLCNKSFNLSYCGNDL